MVVNDKMLERLSRIKKDCKVCNGLGFSVKIEDDTRVFEDCSCVVKLKRDLSYIDANIPRLYLKWDISQLTDAFKTANPTCAPHVQGYIANISYNLDEGIGFWLASTPGLAKSSMAAYVVRKATDAGHICYFERAANLHSKLFDALKNDDAKDLISHIINNVELLVIEEIDKLYLKDDMSFNNKSFFDFLSELYDSNKSLIITSNDTRDQVLSRYPSFVADRLKDLDFLPLKGKSGRMSGK
jgi:hypothetical protein